jgi:hypothetical protein
MLLAQKRHGARKEEREKVAFRLDEKAKSEAASNVKVLFESGRARSGRKALKNFVVDTGVLPRHLKNVPTSLGIKKYCFHAQVIFLYHRFLLRVQLRKKSSSPSAMRSRRTTRARTPPLRRMLKRTALKCAQTQTARATRVLSS